MKPTYRIGTIVGILALGSAILFYQNCGVSPEAAIGRVGSKAGASKVSRQEIADLGALIDRLAAENLSCELQSDCVNLGVGSRACGGFQRFALVSRRSPRMAELETLAQTLESKERTYNEQNDVMGICSIAVEPPLVCRQSKCEVN